MPELRARLIDEGGDGGGLYERMYLMPADAPATYDYGTDDSVAALARARGVSPVEAYIDAMVDSGGKSIVNWPVMNDDRPAVQLCSA